MADNADMHQDHKVIGAEKSLMVEESHEFYMNDLNFLPFFDLRLLDLIPPNKLDIYSNPE